MPEKKTMNLKKQLLLIGVIVVLAAVTVYVLIHETNQLNWQTILAFFSKINYAYVVGCVFCIFMAVFFEGYSLKLICKKLGYSVSPMRSMMWAAADYYFSGITPSASGGQPASVYFMHKDGIPVSQSSAALVFNILQYSLSLLVMGAICLAAYPSTFTEGSGVVQGFLIYGFIALIFLIVLCLLCMFRRSWIEAIGNGLIRLAAKLHLCKHPDQKQQSLTQTLHDYESALLVVKHNPSLMISVFATNVLQRSFTALTVSLLYLALGGDVIGAVHAFALNILCVTAVSAVPIPGAVGVSEVVFMYLFQPLFHGGTATVMLTNRAITFYFCIIVCGIWTLVRTIQGNRREKKKC